MTILHHDALLKALDQGLDDRLVIMPLLDRDQVGPASIDLRLGTEFIELHRLERVALDPFPQDADVRSRELIEEERVVVPLGGELILHPGQFVLGATLEFVRMPTNLAGEVLNRSSWARMGLMVATAVFVQPGYAGVLTLELVNMGSVPMKLHPGLRIAQLVVMEMPSPTTRPYHTGDPKYRAPLGPQSSRIGSELDEWNRLRRIEASARVRRDGRGSMGRMEP